MRCTLCGTFFSSKVRRTLCENGPETKKHTPDYNTNRLRFSIKTQKCSNQRKKKKKGKCDHTVSKNIRSTNSSFGSDLISHFVTEISQIVLLEWNVETEISAMGL